MCIPAHPYGAVNATRRVKTDYGTYDLCETCFETACAGGYVQSVEPIRLAPEEEPPACECEHANHQAPAESAQKGTRS